MVGALALGLYLIDMVSKKKRFMNYLLLLATVYFSTFLLEVVQRCFTQKHYTIHERSFDSKRYFSPYEVWNKDPFMFREPNTKDINLNNEFSYTREVNSIGFYGKEPLPKVTNTVRILCIGDSFTQGVGAPADSTFPSSLEYHLDKMGIAAEVINGGMSGYDPVYANHVFKEVMGEVYNPDIVLLTLNLTDVDEIIIRGGAERFRFEEGVVYRKSPWYEPLYATSHFVRSIVHSLGYDSYFLRDKTKYYEQVKETITAAFEESYEYLKSINTYGQLIVLIHPMHYELTKEFDHSFPIDDFSLPEPIKVTNLKAPLASRIQTSNLSVEDIYWQYDKHHNAEGYWLLGEVLADELYPLISSFPEE